MNYFEKTYNFLVELPPGNFRNTVHNPTNCRLNSFEFRANGSNIWNKYHFIYHSDLPDYVQDRKEFSPSYYNSDYYSEICNSKYLNFELIDKFFNTKLTLHTYAVKEGKIATLRIMAISENYYNPLDTDIQYTFTVEWEMYKGGQKWPKIYLDTETFKIIPPANVIIKDISDNENAFAAFFYKYNFIERQFNYNYAEHNLEEHIYAFKSLSYSLECLLSQGILFELTSINFSSMSLVEFKNTLIKHNNNQLINIDSIVFQFLRQIGYFSYKYLGQVTGDSKVDSYISYFHPNYNYDYILDLTFISYYFFDYFLLYKYKLLNLSIAERHEFLLAMAPEEYLFLLPPEKKIDTLKLILLYIETLLTDGDVQGPTILKLIASFPDSLADVFIDFLVNEKIYYTTKYKNFFEAIYASLDDNRIARYPIVGMFADKGATHLKYFCALVYKLWQHSKYNFYNPNTGQINSNCVWFPVIPTPDGEMVSLIQKNDGFIEFHTTVDGDKLLSDSKDQFTTTLINGKIKIEHIVYFNNYDPYAPGGFNHFTDQNHRNLGEFHLFEPVYIIGFTPDFELEIPQMPYYPAFLFHYMQEFRQLKEFDAATALIISVSLDVGLLFLPGGGAMFSNLRHLRAFIPGFNTILSGSISTAVNILKLKGLIAVTDIVTVSSSLLSSLFTYLAETSTNIADYEKRKSLANIFSIACFVNLFSSIGLRIALKRHTNIFINNWTLTELEDPTGKIRIFLNQIAGNAAENIVSFNSEINKICTETGTEGGSFLYNFGNLSESKKIEFINDFPISGMRTGNNVTKVFEAFNTAEMTIWNNWAELLDLGYKQRKYISIISSTGKINTLKILKSYNSLDPKIEKLFESELFLIITKFKEASTIHFEKLAANTEVIDSILWWNKNSTNIGSSVKGNLMNSTFKLPIDNFLDFHITFPKIEVNNFTIFDWNKTMNSFERFFAISNYQLIPKIKSLAERERILWLNKFEKCSTDFVVYLRTNPELIVKNTRYLEDYSRSYWAKDSLDTLTKEKLLLKNADHTSFINFAVDDFLGNINNYSNKFMDQFTMKAYRFHYEYPDLIVGYENFRKDLFEAYCETLFGSNLEKHEWRLTIEQIEDFFNTNKLNGEKALCEEAKVRIEFEMRMLYEQLEGNLRYILDNDIVYTGYMPGLHGEIRVANTLYVTLKDTKGYTKSFDVFLTEMKGMNLMYGRKAAKQVHMPGCACCTYILKGEKLLNLQEIK